MLRIYQNKTDKIGFLKNRSLIFLLFILSSVYSLQSVAQNYIVNSNADANAVNLVTGDAGGFITLRSAIQAATAQPGAHIITFSGAVVSPINLTLGQITVGNAANGNNITITGPGMNSLTVNQTTENRIFSTGTGAVTFLLQDITLNYTGPAVTPYSGGGGAIIAGGAGAATTLINCRISNFQRQLGNGGAISASSSLANHSLTITNCIFTNNRSGGAGGAVSYNSQGGTAIITGCTFDNNHTGPVGANTGGDGGAISVTGGGSGGTYLIEKNTFLNNQVENVTGHAGAIMSTNGTATIRYNRFIGNTCANVAFPPLANIVGQAGGATTHVTIADNNWWGVNTGPGANDATALAAGAVMTLTKWLQLKTTASPNPICASSPSNLGHTSTVTTSFLSNSANEAIAVANLTRVIGLPVTWSSTLGSLSGQQGTIQASGTATALFTSNGTGGIATVNTQVDNIPAGETSPARANITVNTLSTPPSGATGTTTICFGTTTTLTVSGGFKGTGAVTQWYTSSCGGTLAFTGDVFTTPALNTTTTYYVRYNGDCNTTTCAQVIITVLPQVNFGTVVSPSVSHLVISQVYGGGGNSGATYTNDYIEIFNPTGSTISVTGWSVQYASAAGTTWAVTNLSGSIAPGKYYLVQEAVGAGGTTALPTPDATGTIAMSATAGKVALVNSTVALSGSGCPFGASIVDFVGFGTTANCFEGAGPTPAPSNTTAVLRAANGCTDTDNNSSDFSAGTPTPRNSASTANLCASTLTVCSGAIPGSMSVTGASGGSGTFTYQWYSKGGVICPTGTDISGWTALGAGDGTGFNTTTFTPTAPVTADITFAVLVTAVANAGLPACPPPTWANGCRVVVVNNLTGGTVAASQTICSGGDPAAFTETVASTGDGTLSYQWQSSTTDCSTDFSNIEGATSPDYDAPTGLTIKTYYRRVTTSTLNGVACTANSNCITITVAPIPAISCPTSTATAACQTQSAVNSAFTAWLASASGSGGIGGVLTNNNTGAPPACGGATTVTFTYTTSCEPTISTCQATFTVTAPNTVVLTCAVTTSTPGGQTQAAVNAAFTTWLATASGTGGCNGVLTNNNSGAPPASGGSTTVTFTYTSSCAPFISTCQATFTVLPPVSITCPVNTTAAACQTQAAINSQFAAWLATVSASGGCNGVITNNNTGAPSACGGTTTVLFTYTSTCEPFTTTCSATFTVTAAPVVSLTCPVNTTTAACLTQAQVNTAFSTWLATASASGGCNGVLTNNNTGAPPACGGSTIVTFTYTSTCAPLTTTCQATFTVPAAPTVSLTCPVNTSTAACLTQLQVNTAFSAWLATASASGGCNGVLTNNNTGAPPACGGSTTVTFTYTSTCAPLTTTCQATFTVPAAPTVSLTCPVNTSTAACLTQVQVNTAFSAWLATASASGGCNGVLTNNNTGAPPACGGSTTVTFTYTSSCAPLTTTCQATFTVPAPPTVSLTCPVNTSTSACLTQAQVNTAFSAWLATASASGGCNGMLTNNNIGAPPACGGSTTVTFTYTSSCAPFTTTCLATFTVPAAPTVSLTCPVNTTTSACLTQAQVNSAFSTWLATATASGGCNGVLTNNNIGAPTICVGGSTIVTFTYTSSCVPFISSCQATFTVPAPSAVVLTCPVNTTSASCQTQTSINTAFAAWLATASASGGCNGSLTNNNTGAPPACGGSTTVTFTYSSSCTPLTTICQATFTVPADVTPPAITNATATPASLWPPNHQMKDVYIGYTATDCGAVTTSLSVTSNEPINGTGDGDTAPDWEIIDDHNVKLRAERAGNGNGRTYTITITATDACGNSSTKDVIVIVAHNITGPISGKPFKVGSTVNFSGVFWDKPGNRHTGKWLIDGNTSVNATITEPSGNQNGKSTGSYKFNSAGVYKLRMNVTDQTGVTSYANTNGDLEAIVVIYDPKGGYTYGGGWYQSQPGAVISDPSATGKASFGFTVNYTNATNPKGESQFEFKVGSLEFNALNFDYLVVQGARAQFRGTGKIIGGQSGIAFIMTVIDGELDGSGIDKVRMKIFNKTTNAVYYDNMPGESDAADPITPVGNNSIVFVGGVLPSIQMASEDKNTITKQPIPEELLVDGLAISVHPNPTSSNYTFVVNTSNKKDRIMLQVFDLNGKMIEVRNNIIPGSAFKLGDMYRPGSYFIHVVQGKEHKEMKLIKLSN